MVKIQINTTCIELSMGNKYKYSMPELDLPKLGECDSTWQTPNGTVLGYETSLILDNCVNGIRYIERCFKQTSKTEHVFNVLSTSTPTVAAPYESGNSTQTHDSDPNLLWLILIGLILILLVLGFIERRWKVLTRLKDRCCQHTDKETRIDDMIHDEHENGGVVNQEASPAKQVTIDMDSDDMIHDEHKNGGVVNGEAIPLKNANNDVNPHVGKQEENINDVHHEEDQLLQTPADESRVS